MIEKFLISRDDSVYQAWPDVALTKSGKLVCVFSECTHHGDRSYTRVMLADSFDRGRTWTPKRPLTEGTHGKDVPYWNCARITQLRDGRLAVVADKIFGKGESRGRNYIFFSSDEGATWTGENETPIKGIVPDKLLELESGRWIIGAHINDDTFGFLHQRLHYSDDKGKTWSEPVTVGRQEGLNLCEVSIIPVKDKLVAFMRENSFDGKDCYKSISTDNGEHWSEVIRFPLPACHRPVAGHLKNGQILITHRFMQGGQGWCGWWTQNFFAALTDDDSALGSKRSEAHVRILPVDFDRSPESDTGYSGWVQFDDGEIYVVNYIVDDAPKGQIRGYSLNMEDFLLEKK